MKNSANILNITAVVLAIFIFVPSVVYAVTPAGVVDSGVWFNKEPKANETVIIYSAVFNGFDNILSGTVQFFDYDTLLGEKDFSLSPKTITTVSISWKANVGDHKIQARVINPSLKNSDGKDAVFLDWHKTSELKISITPPIIASTSHTDKDGDSNSSSVIGSIGDTLSGAIGGAGEFVTGIIPTDIRDGTSSFFEPLETFRIKESDALAIKKDEIKNQYNAIKSNSKSQSDTEADSSSSRKMEKPLKLLQLAGVGAANIAFKSPYFFYTILAIVVFLILRAIWIWFRNKDFGGANDD